MERGRVAIDTLVVPADAGELAQLKRFLWQTLSQAGCLHCLPDIELAAEEIFINIASYAYTPHSGSVSIVCGVRRGLVVLRFSDYGRPYNPLAAPTPTLGASADSRTTGGLGIYLARMLTDGVRYRHCGNQNILLLCKACTLCGKR